MPADESFQPGNIVNPWRITCGVIDMVNLLGKPWDILRQPHPPRLTQRVPITALNLGVWQDFKPVPQDMLLENPIILGGNTPPFRACFNNWTRSSDSSQLRLLGGTVDCPFRINERPEFLLTLICVG